MRNSVSLVMLVWLAGCQSTGTMNTGTALVGNSLSGVWQGELFQFTTEELEDSDESAFYDVVLINCGDAPEIWLKSGESGFRKIYENYKVESNAGNHLLSMIVDGGGWVETQSWGLVSINSSRASIQWNRMVSNPYLGDENNLRSFGQMGFGEITKLSNNCDDWESDDNKSRHTDGENAGAST